MTTLYLALVAISTAWTLLGLIAVWRVRTRPLPIGGPVEPLTVLKPLCGVDNDLEDNLRTFFRQDHPAFEIVFGVEGNADPAIDVVRRLRAEHPAIPCRIVVHDGGRGLNPKVRNLRAMLDAARHDVLVISDSNIAVEPDYLRRLQSVLQQPGTGLVTSPIAGTGERTVGATLEALHLNGLLAANIALPSELMGEPCAVGKSMMFRRSIFERLGGFESVASVLAEDYVIGRMFHEAGLAVRLAPDPVRNVSRTTSLATFVGRHVRWGMLRFRLKPLAFALEPITLPIVVALAAPLFGVGGPLPLVWAVALTVARDAIGWTLLRGPAGLLRALPLFWLRDALVLFAWAAAIPKRHVAWRGKRVRVSAGTRLYAEAAAAAPTAVFIDG